MPAVLGSVMEPAASYAAILMREKT
jgi:hypothetical protein